MLRCSKFLETFHQIGVIRGADMLPGKVVQLFEVESRRRLSDPIQAKPFDGLFGREKLVIPMASAEPR